MGIEFSEHVACMFGSDVNGSLGAHNEGVRKLTGVRDDERAIRSMNKIAKV